MRNAVQWRVTPALRLHEIVVMLWETGRGAGLVIEGGLQFALEAPPDALAKRLRRIEPAHAADCVEPAYPGGDVTDLVAIDAPHDGGALQVADALELGDHFGSDVEPACLEHERHDGKTREQVIGGCFCRFPEPGMRRQIAIPRSEICQPPHQQFEVQRLLARNTYPIVKERAGQSFARKPRDQVPGEIDCVELDMRESMQEGDTSGGRAESPALRHFSRGP